MTDAFLRVEHLQNVFRIYLDDCFYYDDLTPVLLFLILFQYVLLVIIKEVITL